MSAPRRWPLHPQPVPLEALSSWLERTARLYGLSSTDLLRYSLGPASAPAADTDNLDWDPPQALLDALAERTGTPRSELRLMTIGGWVPWLADTLDADAGSEAFHTYVRQDSVLLSPGESGANAVGRWLPWFPAERPARRAARRLCPVCAARPAPVTPLTATIPIMLCCPEHGCRLEAANTVMPAVWMGKPPPHRAAPEHLLALDRLTREALTTAAVTLPRRSVHVGVWLRLLRTLLDEVSLATTQVRKRTAAALERIWEAAGHPPRAGISVWRPYETFDIARQETMLEAAATALDLIRTGKIVANGSLGPLLTVQPHRRVGDGDRPSAAELARRDKSEAMRQSWATFQQELEAWFATARTDPAAARQIFGILTYYSPTQQVYEKEREFMIRQGIPASFLPDPEPGRFKPEGPA